MVDRYLKKKKMIIMQEINPLQIQIYRFYKLFAAECWMNKKFNETTFRTKLEFKCDKCFRLVKSEWCINLSVSGGASRFISTNDFLLYLGFQTFKPQRQHPFLSVSLGFNQIPC